MKYILLTLISVSSFSCSQSPDVTNSGTALADGLIINKTVTSKTYNNMNEYLIHIESTFNDEEMKKYLSKYNIKILSKLTKNKYLVEVQPDLGLDKIKNQIKSSKFIKYIELNNEYKIMKSSH
ncbi:MAG: hypothetical protein ACC657_12885 [Thiohalomonadales bacterium]